MNINIKGTYIFKQEGEIIFKGENIITFYGESFFLNRCINDSYNPIQYIAIGNANSVPLRTDTKLGNETSRKTCIKEADLQNKQVKLSCSFTASEIVGTTEIGVVCLNSNDVSVLISHDTFEKINEGLLTNLTGSVEVEYSFQFSTSTIRTGWSLLEGKNYTYYLYEPSNVCGVIENGVNGYKQVSNKDLVESNNASYSYDSKTKNIYIHTVNNSNPNGEEILVQTKGEVE